MRLLFLGAGAVGGYFGGRLAEAGQDVTFLVRAKRQQQLADGLKIDSPMGDAVIPLRTILSGDATDETFDLIVLTSKAYGLDGALDGIAPYVREGTTILPLLNGLAHLNQIETRFPDAVVLGGVAQIPAELTPDGTVLHKGKLAGLIVGPRPGQESSEALAQDFVDLSAQAGIAARFSRNPMQDMWDKWIYLCTLAAATTLCRADVGAILRTQNGAMLLNGLLDECTAVATAEGYPPTTKKMEGYREQLSDRDSKWSASMRVDLERGNPTEADHILGQMIARAQKHGLPCPLLRTCYTPLQVYEGSRT